MQSTIHEIWARRFSTTLEIRLTYTQTDCFETFPFPINRDSNLEIIGEAYHEHRRQVILTPQEGLTTTHNSFHSPKEMAPDTARLRELHAKMDNAVAAYGWQEMELGYARTYASEDEAMARQIESQLSVVDERMRDLEAPGAASAEAARSGAT